MSLDASHEESSDAIIAISFAIKYKHRDINKLFYNLKPALSITLGSFAIFYVYVLILLSLAIYSVMSNILCERNQQNHYFMMRSLQWSHSI